MNSLSWIAVDELLPEEGSTIIGWTSNGKVMVLNNLDVSWHLIKYSIEFWQYPVSPYDGSFVN